MDKARNTADVLRRIADRLEAGDSEDEWGPIIWLIGRKLTKTARART